MRKLGLIGGMSWESTALYYQHLNKMVQARLGGLHSASLLLHSFDFAEIAAYQAQGQWEQATAAIIKAAQALEAGGADCVMICTNTMHKMAPEVAASIHIPLLHIADATGRVLEKKNLKTPCLLGTAYTMEEDFYKGHLERHYPCQVMTPNAEDRKIVHDIIYNELCQGQVREQSREQYQAIIQKAVDQGADSVILGCTEIGLLISQENTAVPVLDTLYYHCLDAVDFALS